MDLALHLILTIVFMLASLSDAGRSACYLKNCRCTQIETSQGDISTNRNDVICDVLSITASDPTLSSLLSAVKSLTLRCTSVRRQSVLSPGTFQELVSLESLAVEQCNISVMTSESFTGLVNLTSLAIAHTTFPVLENDAFSNLPNLKNLTIVYCNLRKLTGIGQLLSLQYLDVSNNDIEQIDLDAQIDTSKHAGCCPNISDTAFNNLTTIDLSYNKMDQLPLNLIRRTPYLQKLYLKGLPLKELRIPEEIELLNLTVLDVGDTRLEVVDFPGLSSTIGLQALRLMGIGQPVDLPDMSSLSQLLELTLTNLGITDSIWNELRSPVLLQLDLSNNNLTSVEIDPLQSLKFLRLGVNNISQLQDSTFQNHPDLIWVNVSHNLLSSLPWQVFQSNPVLQVLDLNHNHLESLDAGCLRGLDKLMYLDISYNWLGDLSYTIFSDTISMRFLYFQSNKLKVLPQLKYMPAIQILNISYNEISSLQYKDLEGPVNLQIFNANNNKLTFLPSSLFSTCCPNLLELWLQNNQLRDLGTTQEHPNLERLWLDNNQLTDSVITSPFINMKKLLLISLDRNNFTSLKLHTFPPSLVYLSIDQNKLNTLYSTSFDDLPNLQLVSWMKNTLVMSIPSVTVSVFRNHHPKPVFFMTGSTYRCDCDMAYLKVIAEDGYVNPVFSMFYPKFQGLERTTCYTPYEGYQFRPLTDVPLSHFACQYFDTWCDIFCSCCGEPDQCPCSLTCPDSCECYYAGSGFKKIYIHIHCGNKNLTKVPSDIPLRAVNLHMDGNNLTQLKASDLSHLRDTEIIYLNKSQIQSIENGTFDSINALSILRLEDNLLTSVGENLFGNLTFLKILYLHNNLIKYLSPKAFSLLPAIETITLHNNRLTKLAAVPEIPSLLSITLSNNPWSCECGASKIIFKTIHALNDIILDRFKMCCYVDHSKNEHPLSNKEKNSPSASRHTEELEDHNKMMKREISPKSEEFDSECLYFSEFSIHEFCTTGLSTALDRSSSSGLPPHLTALIVVVILLTIISFCATFVIFKRREIQAWTFVKLGVRMFDKKAQIDKEDAGSKAFDAFVSYSSLDAEFVASTIVPGLEAEDKGYHLCVHYRDFPVGRHITDTIFRAIENSSRTILLLSENFLKSEWCRFEFQTAHHHILREGSHRLIIIVLGDLPDDLVDPDLKVHLKSKTYLKYGDPWFWEKLFFALPDIRERKRMEEEQNEGGENHHDALRGMKILADEGGDACMTKI